MLKHLYVFVLFLITPVATFADDFVAGKDYVVVDQNNEAIASEKAVIITEFFSYGCPWCYKLEPQLDKWVNAKGNKVFYEKVPVVFHKDWEYYAKAYYTVQALSMQDTVSPALFKAVITDKLALNNNNAMVDFLKQQGIDANFAYSAFYNSPSIDIELNNSKRRMINYKIGSVPAVIVHNKYKTDLQMAKSEERFFAILDYLVEKSAKENG